VRRKDDRENAVWDGLETCGRLPRRVLNYLALSAVRAAEWIEMADPRSGVTAV